MATRWSGMKPKVRAAKLNAESELFQFKANITYLIKSKAQKYHILRNQHKILRKIITYSHECGNNRLKTSFCMNTTHPASAATSGFLGFMEG